MNLNAVTAKNASRGKLVGIGFAPAVPQSDIVTGPIMLDDIGMVYRDIAGPLLEIADRIAARLHYVADQCIGKGDGARWIIDEPRLHFVPAL